MALQGGSGAGRGDPGYDEKIAWLRQVLDWKDAVADAGEWLQQFKSSLFTDLPVLTPQGKVIDLPRGSTPVDFAYALHTNRDIDAVALASTGAMVPLNTPLSGQRVRSSLKQTGPSVGPSRDWLNRLGYVVSHRAHQGAAVQGAAARGDHRSRTFVVERELQRG